MLALLLACHDPDSSPSSDDSAPGGTTDTGLDVFNPERELDWPVVDGTDGDCGTAWPVGRKVWEFEATLGNVPSEDVGWGIEPALSRTDVWDALLAMVFPTSPTASDGVLAFWRMQCDHGSVLLLGVKFGHSWRAHGDDFAYVDTYSAAFSAPIEIGLADSTFDVAGEMWFAHDREAPDSMDPWPATFAGTVTNVGTEPISMNDGTVDATHLVIATDADLFVELFPSGLWLTETEGLVQFRGPVDDAIAITVD